MKRYKYSTYILTPFDTEIEREFYTKKDMLEYLKNEFWVKDAITVFAFKLDAEMYKTAIQTKYSKFGG